MGFTILPFIRYYAKTSIILDIQTRGSRHETQINNNAETMSTTNNFTTPEKK